jgi:uncharacterized repeat protein (TIGR04052 family)
MNGSTEFLRKRRALAACAASLSLMLAACGGGGDSAPSADGGGGGGDGPLPSPAEMAVAIDFVARAGDTAVSCDTPVAALGVNGVKGMLRDLRFYVSEVVLIDQHGAQVPVTLDVNDWQTEAVALVDLEDATGDCAGVGTAALNPTITGKAPGGAYTGMRMTIGVPASSNHSDYAVAAAPLDIQGMAWSWQAGRKFMKIEVNPEGGVIRPAPAAPGTSFFVHLGSTGCTGNPVTGETVTCANPNRMSVQLDSFDPLTQQVVIDIGKLFEGSDLGFDGGGAVGCMSGASDPECPAVFGALQIRLEDGQPIDGGRAQAVFRADRK